MRAHTFLPIAFLLCLCTLPAAIAAAQISLLESEQTAFKQAAEFTAGSVVQIETYASLDGATADQNALGTFTGTIVDGEGWIITSLFHLRSQSASIAVLLANKERVSAKLVARDFSRELALLKIEGTTRLVAAIPSPADEWKIGQWVIALGKSFDPTETSRSVGILSAQGRAFDKAFQIDAKVSPLNYGGPVVDLRGRVMGILTPINPNIATEGEVQQWYDSGVAFAVPIQDILDRLPKMKEGKDLHPGRIGIRPKSKDDFGGPVTLAGVSPGSPAAKAGLRAGDVIKKVQGRPIEQMNQFRHALGPVDAEQVIELEYERENIAKSTKCELVKEIPLYREPYFGFMLTPSIEDTNLEIGAIVPGSPAEKGGLKVGQKIERVDGELIENRNKLREVLSFADIRSSVRFRVMNGSRIGEKGADNIPKQNLGSDVSIQAIAIPKELPTDLPSLTSPSKGGEGKGIVDIPLGDLPNKVFAYVPTNYAKDVPHGLMVMLPEAGEVNRKEWVDAFEPFCREQRWLVVVVASADAKLWSLEEVELIQRLIRQVDADYAIDSRRIAVGGLGTGGTLALVGAMQQKNKIRGLCMIESKLPMAGRFQTAEPMETTHWMLIGSRKEYPRFADSMNKLGYPISVIEQTIEPSKPDHRLYAPVLQRWLRRLESY